MGSRVNFVALFIVLVSFTFSLTGLVTEYWSVNESLDTHTGLWRMCNKFVCNDGGNIGGIGTDDLTAVKVLIIIGLATGGLTGGFIIYDIMMKKNKYISMALVLLAAVTDLAGSITYMYACRYDENNDSGILWTLSWSFALTTAAGAGYVISGILLAFEKRRQLRGGDHRTDYTGF